MPPQPTASPSTATVALAQAADAPTRGAVEDLLNLLGLGRMPFKGVFVTLLDIALLLFAFLLLRSVVRRLIRRATEGIAAREEAAGQAGRAQRIRTLASLTQSVLSWTLGFVIGVAALSTLGINVLGLIGTAGVAGLAVGFGAQKLVKDVITGFFILMEDQYAVGDYVTINGVTGTVEELGMRITRVRDDEGKLYIFSNGDIGTVCNQSRGPVAGSFEVAVAASADVAKATEVLNAAFADLGEVAGLSSTAQVAGVTAVTAAATTLKVTFHATAGHRPAQVALRLREAAREALRQAEIALG
jgi:small conductance mechanosensitive channel